MSISKSGGFRLLAAVSLTAGALVGSTVGSAVQLPASHAAPCPDVELIFARGTFEAPGVGTTGTAFADALRAKLDGKSLDVYAVNYPASLDFPTAADGIIDASNKVRDMAANCPNTKLVLGGFSQGAAVMGYITEDAVPPGYPLPPGITGPMAPAVASHVAGVALFGKPSNGFLQTIARDAPPIEVGPLYTAKTIDLCVPADPVCSVTGSDSAAHGTYATNRMADQAADFVIGQIAASSTNNPVVLSGAQR